MHTPLSALPRLVVLVSCMLMFAATSTESLPAPAPQLNLNFTTAPKLPGVLSQGPKVVDNTEPVAARVPISNVVV